MISSGTLRSVIKYGLPFFSESAVAVNIRREVFAFGVLQTSSDESAWTAVWDRYTSADGSDQQRDDLLHALCQTTNLTLIDLSLIHI